MSKKTEDNSKENNNKPTAAAGEKKPEKSISFFHLFRFYETKDIYFMVIGVLAAIANGTSMPVFALIMGGLTDDFSPNNTGDEIVDTAGEYSLYFFIIGLVSFVLSYFSFGFWMVTGERQAIAFRKAYFKALIR